MPSEWAKSGTRVQEDRISLQELGIKYHTDKATLHGYLPIYEQYLKPIRKKILNVLEIGVAGGCSLRMWKEFFPCATIHGLDIMKKCQAQSQSNICVHIGNSTDPQTVETIFPQNNAFEIIIDDGSHHPIHQIFSLCLLWPKLKTGGFYFIEDIGSVPTKGSKNLLNWFGPFRQRIFAIHKRNRYDDVLLMIKK
jgi:hypothetical protein